MPDDMIPAMHAVRDRYSHHIVQSYPFNESGNRKAAWFVRATNEGNPKRPHEQIVLYMERPNDA